MKAVVWHGNEDVSVVDRLSGLLTSIETVRGGGTLSIIGVYGGAIDPLPMLDLFDKGITIRTGQAHVKRWGRRDPAIAGLGAAAALTDERGRVAGPGL